ncbi:hypothetical protein ABDD95_07025 [Mucilaginibacter sp. PAMB04274]|uniref:hypothetical protein n=1 Tax=Mucilaginibacter sp. PAMB04274 TaxID=3138568 RepID=UPI0031F71A49
MRNAIQKLKTLAQKMRREVAELKNKAEYNIGFKRHPQTVKLLYHKCRTRDSP